MVNDTHTNVGYDGSNIPCSTSVLKNDSADEEISGLYDQSDDSEKI